MSESIAFWAGATCYAIGTALFFAALAFKNARLSRAGVLAAAAGLVPHGIALGLRWAEVGHGPFSTRFEVLSANAFVLVALYLGAVTIARPLRSLGVIVLPLVFLLLGFGVSSYGLRNEVPIIFKSYWLYLHIGFAKAFGAATLLATAAAAAYLLKLRRPERFASLPTPERLDLYGHQFLLVAFLCLGIMIVAGSLWANQSWGRYWAWDPIETAALGTWIGYGIVLHFRVLHRWTGRRMAYLTFLAFLLMLGTIYVVVLVTPTIHDFYLVGPS